MDEELRERILTQYLGSPEGRAKLGQSFLHPVRLRHEFREHPLLTRESEVDVPDMIDAIIQDLALADRIFQACSSTELLEEPFPAMQTLVAQLQDHRQLLTWDGTKLPKPVEQPPRLTSWEYLLGDDSV